MNSGRPHISAVSPVYRAASLIPKLVSELELHLGKISDSYEIVLVEDCGPDDSWEVIQRIAKKNPRVRGAKLSRNFGQQYALNAGLDLAKGDWILTLDCDLQDQPSEIYKLYDKAKEGYDIVLASRINRQDDFLKKFVSRAFNRLLGYLTDTIQDPTVANFVLYKRSVVEAMGKLGDYYRYYPMMVQWVGFNRAKVEIQHADREEGGSSYSFSKRLNLAIDTIIAFSDKPLRLTVRLGVLISVLAIAMGIRSIAVYFLRDFSVAGWTSLILTVSFFSGLIISILGMIGLYVGKMFETVKDRPTYIVQETIN